MSRANVARIVRSCFTGFTIVTTAAWGAPQAFEVGSQQKDQLPRGKEADGIIGDFVLRNNQIEAVISGNLPLRRANMSTFYGLDGITPGCLYDLRLRGANSDQVIVRALSTQSRTNPAAYPDAEGRFTFQLPEGDYELEFADLGRTSVKRTVTVKAAEPTAVDAAMDLAAVVVFDIRDAAGKSIPCKAQFLGIEGTASPYLGPHNRAHGCVDQYHSEQRHFRVALPPGQYQVVVTRGIEYSHVSRTIDLKPEQTVAVIGTLKRLLDTTGWVSADYHNHSTPSGDNTCGTDDRIINLAAEHIEFAPTTEHNRL